MEIRVPDLGESLVEATVARWLKQEGDAVSVGEPIVELETDKVDLEVGAKSDGVLQEIRVPEGEDVQVGDVLAVVEPADVGEQPAETETPVEKTGPAEASQARPEPAEAPAKEASITPSGDGAGEEKATPVARRLAQEQSVDLNQVSGSGPGDRITKEDVQRYLDQRESQPAAAAPAGKPAPKSEARPAQPRPAAVPQAGERREERVRMSRRRRTIAARLVEAQQNAAMLTTFNDVDMSAVMEIRSRRKQSFLERHGVKLGFMSFFVKAAVGALKQFPELNAEIDGDEIIRKYYYDIGIAIGAEEGLVVPVVRNADRLTFADIEQAIGDYVKKTQEGSLSIEELRGGTFTISNGGVYGSLLSTPILNPPQVGVLGLHRIEQRPVAEDGKVVIRPMMYLALTYDHRVVDGREAVSFLGRIKDLIEDPESLLLEG